MMKSQMVIDNLGVLARLTHDKAIGLDPVNAEQRIRQATRFEKAQREMENWEPWGESPEKVVELPTRPYTLAGVLQAGPNTSTIPKQSAGAFQGVMWAIVIEVAIALFVVICGWVSTLIW